MFRFFVIFSVILLTTVICEINSQILLSKHNKDGRIVGGTTVNITDYSYIVSINYKNFWTRQLKHWCGGCIYNETIIITANHCVLGRNPNDFKIRAGSQKHNEGGQLIDVDRIITHTNYSRRTYNNDIALIVLKSPLKFSDSVSQINLPNDNTIIPIGSKAYVSGWGVTKEGSRYIPDKLQAAEIEVFDRSECEERYGEITDQMLCAGVHESDKDSCQGDSGGPLVTKNRTLIGLVSWGYGCARKNYPGVYTNILNLFKWILKN